MAKFEDIDKLCINTIRTLSIDMVEKAKSGHPGLPLGAAPMAYVLWTRHLKFNPQNPDWHDRDRFVLAAGHGSALLYSMLHLTGYAVSMDEIKNFRQLGSITPGHPEFSLAPGVEATTGPLGQGDANAVGMAIAERALANRFNRPGYEIVNHFTYALSSDGGLMEGVSAEAASLAGHLKLGKLIVLFDSNDVSLDGPTSLSFSTEDVGKRYEAYGWQVLTVKEGNTNLKKIDEAIVKAKAETEKPSLIIIKTTIGYGSPNKAGKSKAHGSPLGAEEVVLTKKALGWDPESEFYIPDDVKHHFHLMLEGRLIAYKEWQGKFAQYEAKYPALADEWQRVMSRNLPEGWDENLPQYKPQDKKATRHASKDTLNALANKFPELIGGSADVSMSTLAVLDDGGTFEGQTGSGRNIFFGVREHGMAAIANGMAYHGGVIPFVSTYFVFTDYLRAALRLSAMNKLPVIYITTHDSIAAGEDGPTHQPVEHLMSLRSLPGLNVIRPADSNETVEAWKWIMQNLNSTSMLVLTRQNLPTIDRSFYAPASGLHKGAYVISEAEGGSPQAIIIATGSEVHIALEAQKLLLDQKLKVRVVSMPCWGIFEMQDKSYRNSVLPPSIMARVSVEAGSTSGWQRWIGCDGIAIGVDKFGISAPGDTVMKEFGFTPENVVEKVKMLFGQS